MHKVLTVTDTKQRWEITDFEELLHDRGYALGKFWLHIDAAEQRKRFEAREKTSYKQFKITEEDYRNSARRAEYEDAVNEMVERTSTEFAPWTLIEANDKRVARLHVLRTFLESWEKAVEAAG